MLDITYAVIFTLRLRLLDALSFLSGNTTVKSLLKDNNGQTEISADYFNILVEVMKYVFSIFG
jgi:hypothetical protein